MPSTYHCLLYHLVFGTKNIEPSIRVEWRAELHAYLGGCLRTLDGVSHGIGGVGDHVHIFAGLKPAHVIADVMRDIKRASSAWVHDDVGERRFAWQDGYGAFTVSRSQSERLKKYIAGQDEHHRGRSFREEYERVLRRHGIEFQEEYLW